VNKWFLGVIYPSTVIGTSSPVAYQAVSASIPLFSPGESASSIHYYDTLQGALGDCWVLSALDETATRDPQAIWNMIFSNGNGTYTVRFNEPNGETDYITVDLQLPGGGTYFDNVTVTIPGNGVDYTNQSSQPANPDTTQLLWVALLEKALAQENAEDFLPLDNPGADSYAALNGGSDSQSAQLTQALNNVPDTANGFNTGTLTSDWENGELIQMSTSGTTQATNSANIVESHVYAVVGYNSSNGVFTLYNPWGLDGLFYQNNVFCSGLVTATANQLGQSGDFDGIINSTVGSAPETPHLNAESVTLPPQAIPAKSSFLAQNATPPQSSLAARTSLEEIISPPRTKDLQVPELHYSLVEAIDMDLDPFNGGVEI
jgi:hypothetical protein